MKIAIKILGSGCPKCKSMATVVNEVVNENDISASIEKVEDIMEIMEYNVLVTPVLVINEKITIKGRVPSPSEVLNLLNDSTVTEM
jgi:small redox-active disulfide protein 2